MSENIKSDLTIEQVCRKLTAVRDGLIGDEGESIVIVQMFDSEVYGRVVGGDLKKVELLGGAYLLLELPYGYDFPLQKGNLEDGFTPIRK